MTEYFQNFFENDYWQTGEAFLDILKPFYDIAKAYLSIPSYTVFFDYRNYQDLDRWFAKSNAQSRDFCDNTSDAQSFEQFIAALPITLTTHLFQTGTHEYGLPKPIIYSNISDFGNKLTDIDAELPIFFVSYSPVKANDDGTLSITLETNVGNSRTPYKLEFFCGELNKNYYSFLLTKDEHGLQKWKVVHGVKSKSWEEMGYIASENISSSELAAAFGSRPVMLFYSRKCCAVQQVLFFSKKG